MVCLFIQPPKPKMFRIILGSPFLSNQHHIAWTHHTDVKSNTSQIYLLLSEHAASAELVFSSLDSSFLPASQSDLLPLADRSSSLKHKPVHLMLLVKNLQLLSTAYKINLTPALPLHSGKQGPCPSSIPWGRAPCIGAACAKFLSFLLARASCWAPHVPTGI